MTADSSDKENMAAVRNAGDQPSFKHMHMLLAFDAMLREGSVSGAARSLNMQVSAVSRLLGELRKHYNDKIFIRTGQGMLPTPFAETLRPKLRALAADAEHLIHLQQQSVSSPQEGGWESQTCAPVAPLSTKRTDWLEGAPTPTAIIQRISAIRDEDPPKRRLAKYIAVTARGPGRSRTLTMEEAQDAFHIILSQQADPVQLGAILMTLQYRGVTAPELAGCVKAIRSDLELGDTLSTPPDLDWPCYISSSWRHAPWFIHSARLVAAAGYTVLLHGYFGNGIESGKLELAMKNAHIPVCTSSHETDAALNAGGIAYLPLGAIAPKFQSLLGLYGLFETRTPLHAMPHLLNPFHATSMVLGAAQLSKRDLYRDVAKLLGIQNLTIIGSMRDFAQLSPLRSTTLYRTSEGTDSEVIVPARKQSQQNLPRTVLSQREYWKAVWSGAVHDEAAEATILYTAASALQCLSRNVDFEFSTGLEQATQLWSERKRFN